VGLGFVEGGGCGKVSKNVSFFVRKIPCVVIQGGEIRGGWVRKHLEFDMRLGKNRGRGCDKMTV